jgi:DNA-binding response OmpR family regulator
MVTAKGHPNDLEAARTLGALDYINKPRPYGEVELRVHWALTAVARQREQNKNRLAS